MAEVPRTLYARLRDELQAEILGGRLRPGDRLPSENELSTAHGVSRITVRQALADLQTAGLILRLQGKGAFVAPPHASPGLERLQGLAEALSATGQEVRSRRLSLRTVKARGPVAQQLEVKAGTELVQLVMLRYLDRSPLSVNTSHFTPGIGEKVARIDLARRDLVEVFETDIGERVERAEVQISAHVMPTREARWLDVAPGVPALQVDRRVLAPGGRPLQAETAVYRADSFSYKLTLSR
jgi:GntR family transcriptional regulator